MNAASISKNEDGTLQVGRLETDAQGVILKNYTVRPV